VKNVPLKLRARVALKTIGKLLRKPQYLLLTIVSAFLMLGLVLWSLNIDLLTYVLFQSQVSFAQKLRFFTYVYEAIFTDFTLQNIAFLLFSVLFGINMALFVYVFKRRKSDKKAIASSGSAATIGMLSGGCAACGTSLLTPILASVGGVSAGFAEQLGAILSLLGSLLVIYAIFTLAEIASFSLAQEK
jgi:hypothetical protein